MTFASKLISKTNKNKLLAGGLLLSALLPMGSVPANADSFEDLDKQKLEQFIQEYLEKNPEVLIKSIESYYKEQERLAALEEQKMMDNLLPAIQKSDQYPIAGNPNGSVTLVEFFDYQCGYCKRVLPQVRNAIEDDDDLRVVFVEFPILGPASVTAAQAALAAHEQDKYTEFHLAMMAVRGGINDTTIFATAEKVGLDLARLKEDMASKAVNEQIQRNRQLAKMLNLTGTPAFIIGNEVIRGAIDESTMKDIIAKTREEANG